MMGTLVTGDEALITTRDLPVSARRRLIAVLAEEFKPEVFVGGWQDPGGSWEIANSIRSMVDGLSNETSREATEALISLRDLPQLAAWRDYLAHGLAVQARRRREVAFRYPTKTDVVRTVSGGWPANPADLQAVLVDELRTLAAELRHGSTDGYKAFWNVDSHSRPTEPRPEEDGRDRLLERLRPRLATRGVALEPEGHYADDKRSDIKALTAAINVPVEIKRHYHSDLWGAPINQLHHLYARDPGTGGRGIFLVLWFGLGVAKVPKAPTKLSDPQDAEQLERELAKLLDSSDRPLIEFVVIDCSKDATRK